MDVNSLESLQRRAANARSFDDVVDACRALCRLVDFPYFCFGLRLPTSFVDPELMLAENFPAPFRACYSAMDGLNVDPVLLCCHERTAPVFWRDAFVATCSGTPSAAYVAAVRDMGLRAGVSCGCRGARGEFSVLSVASGRDDAATEERLRAVAPLVHVAGSYLHDAATRLKRAAGSAPLTPRERECLTWSAEGHTARETAQRLRIAERTVIFHLRNVNAKLGVSSRQQAVARAVSLGIVHPRAVTIPLE